MFLKGLALKVAQTVCGPDAWLPAQPRHCGRRVQLDTINNIGYLSSAMSPDLPTTEQRRCAGKSTRAFRMNCETPATKHSQHSSRNHGSHETHSDGMLVQVIRTTTKYTQCINAEDTYIYRNTYMRDYPRKRLIRGTVAPYN